MGEMMGVEMDEEISEEVRMDEEMGEKGEGMGQSLMDGVVINIKADDVWADFCRPVWIWNGGGATNTNNPSKNNLYPQVLESTKVNV